MRQLYFFMLGVLVAHFAPRIITFAMTLSKQRFTSNSLVIWSTAAVIALIATFLTNFITNKWRHR